jgi:uncharacterized protein (TIRG00374 family)
MKRRWLLWLLVLVFFGFVISQLPEIGKLITTLAQGRWLWVLVAACLQLGRYVAFTALFKSAFDLVGVRSQIRELLPVMFASVFVNLVAPVGGASGFALFVDDAARRGQSGARASAGTILALTSEYSGFGVVLVIGLVYLALHHELAAYQLAGAALLALVIGSLAAALILARWWPHRLRSLFGWMQRTINRVAGRFGRASLLAEGWADENATEFTQASEAMTAHPLGLARTLSVALGMHAVNMASLYALFLAFYQPISFGELVAIFGVGMLYWMVSITPQGIGMVEGAMVLVCTSLGVPAAEATAITLAFRGLSLWVPVIVGFFLLRRLRSFQTEVLPPTETV